MSDMFSKDKNNITKAWQYYELGRTYNNSLSPSQYTVVNTNIEFFTGNQRRNLPQTRAMAALPKPVFNIIKRVTSLFVAALTSSGIAVRYEPLTNIASRRSPSYCIPMRSMTRTERSLPFKYLASMRCSLSATKPKRTTSRTASVAYPLPQ